MIKLFVFALLFLLSACFLSVETDKGKLVFVNDEKEECECYEEEACTCTEEEGQTDIFENGAKSPQD